MVLGSSYAGWFLSEVEHLSTAVYSGIDQECILCDSNLQCNKMRDSHPSWNEDLNENITNKKKAAIENW